MGLWTSSLLLSCAICVTFHHHQHPLPFVKAMKLTGTVGKFPLCPLNGQKWQRTHPTHESRLTVDLKFIIILPNAPICVTFHHPQSPIPSVKTIKLEVRKTPIFPLKSQKSNKNTSKSTWIASLNHMVIKYEMLPQTIDSSNHQTDDFLNHWLITGVIKAKLRLY